MVQWGQVEACISMLDFQFYFELIGAVAFAVSGAALAVKKGMDLFGVAMMGMTTAVGGGILRDVMLGQTPPAALLVADSIGLGIFSAHGAAIAIQAGGGDNAFLVLFMGMLTGVGGGVLRDVCCMERPYIFTKHIYACASLAGAGACLLLWSGGRSLALLVGCGVTVVLRICAAVFRWSLPKA